MALSEPVWIGSTQAIAMDIDQQTSDSDPSPSPRDVFTTTRWSIIQAAKQSQSDEAREAMEMLCRTYWLPLYAFARRQGNSPQDAEDLTQGFFSKVIEKEYLVSVDRSKGRFRSFLLASLRHYMLDEHKRATRVKRGGGREILSLDTEYAEERLAFDESEQESPEAVFDRQWALTVTQTALETLENDYQRSGKAAVFDALRPLLRGDADALSYEGAARSLGLTENAFRVSLSRLRQRYRTGLREVIAQTVAHPKDIDDEMRHLFRVLTAESEKEVG